MRRTYRPTRPALARTFLFAGILILAPTAWLTRLMSLAAKSPESPTALGIDLIPGGRLFPWLLAAWLLGAALAAVGLIGLRGRALAKYAKSQLSPARRAYFDFLTDHEGHPPRTDMLPGERYEYARRFGLPGQLKSHVRMWTLFAAAFFAFTVFGAFVMLSDPDPDVPARIIYIDFFSIPFFAALSGLCWHAVRTYRRLLRGSRDEFSVTDTELLVHRGSETISYPIASRRVMRRKFWEPGFGAEVEEFRNESGRYWLDRRFIVLERDTRNSKPAR